MAIGVSGRGIIPLWPLGLILLVLPIREFVRRPERDIAYHGLVLADQHYSHLQQYIFIKSEQVSLKRAPRLLINNKNHGELYVMGSFSRWYIVMGDEKAQAFEDFLSRGSPKNNLVDVQILHELYHFKTGDYWQLGYLSELFKVTYNLMLWAMLFFVAWGFILVLAKDSFFQFLQSNIVDMFPADIRATIEQLLPIIVPTPDELEVLKIKVQGLNLVSVLEFTVNITLPYVVLTSILWLFYRPLLWRIREHYADAGVVHEQGGVSGFWNFILEFTQNPIKEIIPETHPKTRHKILLFLRKVWQGDFWPSTSQRLNGIESPETIYYTWKQIAFFLGFLALALMVLLATPIALPVVGKNPMIFNTLLVVVPLAYFLLPQVVLGKKAWQDGLRVLLLVLGIYISWLLLTIAFMWGLYFTNPNLLMGVLQSAITSIARYAGNSYVDIDLFDFIVRASIINLLQVPIVFVVQFIVMFALLFFFKRILSWYAYVKTSQIFKKITHSLVFGISFVLVTLIMPISMTILNADLSAFSGWSIVWAILGSLVMVGGGGWLYFQDRKYYQKCPACRFVSDFDKKCKSCGTILNPWLWVEYEDE